MGSYNHLPHLLEVAGHDRPSEGLRPLRRLPLPPIHPPPRQNAASRRHLAMTAAAESRLVASHAARRQ
jgi:hypothetical protein